MKFLAYLLAWLIGRVDKVFLDAWIAYSDWRYRREGIRRKVWRR